MNSVWNEVERQFIRDNAGKITDEEGARLLSEIAGRAITIHAWRKQRQKLGLKKAPGRGVCKLDKETKDGRDTSKQGASTKPKTDPETPPKAPVPF